MLGDKTENVLDTNSLIPVYNFGARDNR